MADSEVVAAPTEEKVTAAPPKETPEDKSEDKKKDKSEDKSTDKSEDKSEDKGPDSTTAEPAAKPAADPKAGGEPQADEDSKDSKNGDESKEPSLSGDEVSYFWNVPVKKYLVEKEPKIGRKSTVPVLVYDGTSPPEGAEDVADFVEKHNLKHGDVLAFSDYRDSESYIVSRSDDKDEFKFLKNPDDSNASYLTIPRDVMKNCDNGIEKYQVIIRECVAVNLHVSPSDAFLKKKFGDGEIPHIWDFDIHFSYGELEEIYVRTPGADWEAFDAEETTIEDIKDFFESGRHYKTEFTVTVELEGDKLEEYKEKYGDQDDKNAWMEALPEIPPTWKLVKGESSGADDEYCWEWMLSGLEEDEEEVRESIAHHLRGFEHKFH